MLSESEEPSAPSMIFRFQRTEAEVEGLRAICRAWQDGAERFWSFDEVLGAVIRSGSLVFYAAAARDAPWQGVALVDVGPFSADLLYIYVDRSYRRTGLGRDLLERVLVELKTRPQLEAMLLEVRASNVGAQALYRRLGMEFVSKRARYYADGEDAFVFRMTLAGRPATS